MMLVRDILEQLAFSELAHTNIGGDSDTEVTEQSKYLQVIPAINSALEALHTRFELKFNNILLEQVGHIATYYLRKDYAESSNSGQEFKYLKDSTITPFLGDIIRIDRVIDDCNTAVFVNNESECSSVFLPTYDSIEFPAPVHGRVFNIIYQANHKKLAIEGVDVPNQEVVLPPAFNEALLAYIGYRVYKNRKSLNGESPSNNYFSIYQSECARLESKNAVNLISANQSVGDSGWV